jgi:hypothetical protein
METENWYLEHKSGIMRQVRFALPHYRKHFVGAYGKPEGEAIARETLQRFEVLLPDLPYIGGDENRYTRNLYLAAATCAGSTIPSSPRCACGSIAPRRSPRAGSAVTSGSVAGSPCRSSRSSCTSETSSPVGPGAPGPQMRRGVCDEALAS